MERRIPLRTVLGMALSMVNSLRMHAARRPSCACRQPGESLVVGLEDWVVAHRREVAIYSVRLTSARPPQIERWPHLASRGSAAPHRPGQRRGAGRACPARATRPAAPPRWQHRYRTLAQSSSKFGVMALHVGRHVGLRSPSSVLRNSMTRSMLEPSRDVRDAHALALEVIICTSWRRRGTRTCSLCSSASASGDKTLTLGVLVQHTGERRQHLRVPARRSWPSAPRRAGEFACRARVDYRHGRARGLQRARSLELVAASGLQHGQRRAPTPTTG